MLRDERDYLLKMIAAAAAAVARLREKLVGGGDPASIAAESREAQAALLGRDAGVLLMLDPRSAAQVLGDRQRLEQWRALLQVEADALRAAGQEPQARAVEARITAMGTT